MNWYAAHEIVFIEHLDGIQDEFTVMENVILIEADSSEQAWDKAEAHGRETYPAPDNSGTEENGKPARLVFAGIRRLMKVTAGEFRLREDELGAEITFSVFSVQSREDVTRLVNNESVALIYRPKFRWDE